ncbi:MAG: circularly permuted type 2 ATP-grasp protein [Gemmataceae bacterium]
MRDLYGPQQTLAEGLLPADLVYGNPAFLRPVHGIPLPLGHYLHLYAANVCRDAAGYFWVLGDRSQCPSGAGYALENRIVLSRMLPESYRDCRVQRLAPFFNTLRDTLRALAPRRTDAPHIVLLTPGPYNETYFEHAYLARYLGYPLVEGGDLTVRDNRVFLKVLDGLKPVDVIFRRLDDDYCDPLELRHDSFLGVPGLVQAVRTGTVAVANALGSGLLETPALLAFLPALCRRLLNEELRLPSVATWWCGQPRECEYVITHLDELVVKPALSGLRMEPVFGNRLSREARAELIDRIRARPRAFIGQQRIDLATSPVLAGERGEPRAVVMRAYLAARGDSFAVMPGGLTRVSASADSMVVSMQRGGGSKDTWVLAAGPVSPFSLLRPDSLPVELNRGGNDLPSRMADNLYWLGRYAERAEGLTRLLRDVLVRLTETSAWPTCRNCQRCCGRSAGVPRLPRLRRRGRQCGSPPRTAAGGAARHPPRRQPGVDPAGGWGECSARCATASRPTCGACCATWAAAADARAVRPRRGRPPAMADRTPRPATASTR